MGALRPYRFSIFFLLVLVLIWIARALAPAAAIHEFNGSTMGTTYSIKVPELPRDITPDMLATHIAELLYTLDKEQMSTYAPDSELSRFNDSAPGEFFPVSQDLAQVVQIANEVSELTAGAFDVTVGPLVNRWGFGPRNGSSGQYASEIPPDAEITSLLQQVGYRNLQVTSSPPALRKLRHIYVDLSGVAKGYAVDKLAEFLDSLSVDSYFIEIGGEIRLKGLKPDGSFWVPAIEKPVDAVPEVYAVLSSRGEAIALAGSGDYRNYFEADGVRYSHEIDPRTGYPISHKLAAVYIISDTAAYADAMATAMMVLGDEKGLRLAEEIDLAAYFVIKNPVGENEAGSNETSDEFDERFTQKFSKYLQEEE